MFEALRIIIMMFEDVRINEGRSRENFIFQLK